MEKITEIYYKKDLIEITLLIDDFKNKCKENEKNNK